MYVLFQVFSDSVIEIQQLEQSPSMTNKFRQTQHLLQRQHEQNLLQQREVGASCQQLNKLSLRFYFLYLRVRFLKRHTCRNQFRQILHK